MLCDVALEEPQSYDLGLRLELFLDMTLTMVFDNRVEGSETLEGSRKRGGLDLDFGLGNRKVPPTCERSKEKTQFHLMLTTDT